MEEKMKYHIPAREQTSEEGFSVVEGEKSMITIRKSCNTPEVLLSATEECWTASGKLLSEIMHHISLSLGMESNRFEDMVTPCCNLPENERVATLLRMFRYTRPSEGEEPRIVAESHRDLGLLTIVVGSSAGLEVLEPNPIDPNGFRLRLSNLRMANLQLLY
jgi:isopenicillin N synthase-like dioxygenase